MNKGMLLRKIKAKLLGKLYQKEMVNIEMDTIHTQNQMLLDMEDRGYVEFLNPKTGETVDFDSAINLYMEQLQTELKGS